LSGVAASVLLAAAAPRAMGAVTEFSLHTPESAPTGITAGPDGNLWIAETNSSRIVRVTPAGTVTDFLLPAGRAPVNLAVAAGRVFFTEQADRIGLINPGAGSDAGIQASITEFSVPGVGSAPSGIAMGPDAALWFTERGSDEIGRMTTVGVVTNEFTIPGAADEPVGIVSGPDGTLWFTERGSSEIGRVTTGGVFTEFPVAGLSSTPNGLGSITAGADGALWFVNSGLDQIDRITTGGQQSQFAAPADSGLEGVTAGPDGALWFTEGRSGKIGRMTTSGAVSEYTVRTPTGGPSGIATGPDGALWFTERLAANAGSITTDTPPDAVPTPPTGPPGPPGPPGADAQLILQAFAVKPQKPRAGHRVKVRVVITDAAQVSLTVQSLTGKSARGAAQTVATRDIGAAGIGKLTWSGKLGRKAAKPGRYLLNVIAVRDGETVESALRTRLRAR
jgi:virginiamycin B lyase